MISPQLGLPTDASIQLPQASGVEMGSLAPFTHQQPLTVFPQQPTDVIPSQQLGVMGAETIPCCAGAIEKGDGKGGDTKKKMMFGEIEK